MLPNLPQAPPAALQDAPTGDPQTDQAAPNPMVTVPMTPDEAQKWKGDLERAQKRLDLFSPGWERNLKSYAADPTDEKWGDEVNPGVDFARVEQKKAQLFFDTPTVVLSPEPDVSDPAVQKQISAQGIKLNRKIGRKGLDCKRLMDKVLFDILCPSGEGWIKVGITRIEKGVPHPTDPTQTVQVPTYQKSFAERFSPKQGLKPTNFRDSEFDKAPWLAERFEMPLRPARRQFNLPQEFQPKAQTANTQAFNLPGLKAENDPEETVTGTEVWYKANLYDDAIDHPDWVRQLVFIDGIDDPVVHRDSPYQTYDSQTFDFTPDSMIGFPIHVITIRDLADSAWIPSDSTVRRPLVKELATFRTQLIEHRDASGSIRIGTEKVFNTENMSKVVRGPHGTIITVPDGDYDPARPAAYEVAHPVYSRENFQSQEVIEKDLDAQDAMSANQVGAESTTDRSATEATYVARASNVRLQAEKNRVEAGFLGLVAKIDALEKRYFTPPGQPPLSGYTYDIKPDSGAFVDAAQERKFGLDLINILANNPNVNHSYLLTEVAPKLHLDPSQLIVQPPPPGPPPPKTTMVIRGEDLSPLAPQYANVVEALGQEGMKLTQQPISPEMIQNAAAVAAAKKPISAGKSEPVSKHQTAAAGHPANFGGQAGSEAVQ